MTRAATPIITPRYPTDPVFPLSVEQYHSLICSGALTDDDPVELIEGVLVFHRPKNPPHEFVVHAVRDSLAAILARSGWTLRTQAPITLSDGEPEPDLLVARGTLRDYVNRHPDPTDTALVIEVSDATLLRDRGIKLRSYARAGIAEYWIVNLADRIVEVYVNPDPAASPDPTYRTRNDFRDDADLPVTLAGQRLGAIAVKSILP
jgi:Uma2 family endonuclease